MPDTPTPLTSVSTWSGSDIESIPEFWVISAFIPKDERVGTGYWHPQSQRGQTFFQSQGAANQSKSYQANRTMTNPLIEQPLSPEQIKELRELHTNASGGTWSSDLHGLYVTTDECPLCTPKYQGRGNIMLTSAPVSLDAEDKELIQIRGWGHLQKHKGGERVQKANANLIAAAHNSLPALLSMAERCVVLEERLKRAAQDLSAAYALTRVKNDERLYCRPLRADSRIVMLFGGTLRTLCGSDNGIRLEVAEYDLGPEYYLPGVEWIVLSDLSLAFKNHEDPELRAALTPTNTKDND